MKQLLSSALFTVAIGFTTFTVNELPIGAAMPKVDVKMKDISGKEVSLKDAAKKNGLLVMFSCNTCPFVIKNQGRTKDMAAFTAQNDVGIILINANEGQRGGDDSFDAMQQYAKGQGYTWYYTVDKNSELAIAFGAKRTPECFLFNKEGKLVYHGAIDDNPGSAEAVERHHLKEAITEMVNGKQVSVTTTRSVGCTIKIKA